MYYVAQNETLFAQLRRRFASPRSSARPIRPRREPTRRRAWRIPRVGHLPGAWTEASWLPVFLASLATFGLFRLVLPDLRPSWLTTLLLERGPLQPVTVGVAMMGLLVIAQRALLGIRERRAVRRTRDWSWPGAPIPLSAARCWLAGTVGQRRGWLATRLIRLTDAVATGEPASMAGDRLQQADRRMAQELHQLPRVTLSALPLLGLGGTVLGLSQGMGKLSGFIAGANDLAGLRQVLTSFSGSLATAFDATLLALALLAPLLVLAGVVRGRDETTLRLIDGVAERLASLIERNEPLGVDDSVVDRAAGHVVVAVERGIEDILGRLGRESASDNGMAICANVAEALAELPGVLESVREALGEPRCVDIRVAAIPAAREV
jgi:MotA/TolQ/ExbB proton channel family